MTQQTYNATICQILSSPKQLLKMTKVFVSQIAVSEDDSGQNSSTNEVL